MQAISSILTLRPTDLLTVGRSMANVGSGIFVGAAVAFSVAVVANVILDPKKNEGGKKAFVAGVGALAGIAATFLFAPQVAIPLTLGKVAQVAILTATVAFGLNCFREDTNDKMHLALFSAALPAIGIVGTFLGSYAALAGGVVGACVVGHIALKG